MTDMHDPQTMELILITPPDDAVPLMRIDITLTTRPLQDGDRGPDGEILEPGDVLSHCKNKGGFAGMLTGAALMLDPDLEPPPRRPKLNKVLRDFITKGWSRVPAHNHAEAARQAIEGADTEATVLLWAAALLRGEDLPDLPELAGLTEQDRRRQVADELEGMVSSFIAAGEFARDLGRAEDE